MAPTVALRRLRAAAPVPPRYEPPAPGVKILIQIAFQCGDTAAPWLPFSPGSAADVEMGFGHAAEKASRQTPLDRLSKCRP
jgi:hypothetical protein